MIQAIVTDRVIEIDGGEGAADQQQEMIDHVVLFSFKAFAAALEAVTRQPEAVLKCEDRFFLLDRQVLNVDSRILEKAFLFTLSVMAETYAGYMAYTHVTTEADQAPLAIKYRFQHKNGDT